MALRDPLQLVPRKDWVPDREAKTCQQCKATRFSLTVRRHHCRCACPPKMRRRTRKEEEGRQRKKKRANDDEVHEKVKWKKQ